MMKFFRTHTKHLLAFFMALLLVVWLLGDTLGRGGRDSAGAIHAEWGDVYGKEVSPAQQAAIARSTDILDALYRGLGGRANRNAAIFDWQTCLGRSMRGELQLREWYMLNAEAQHNGIYVPQDAVDQLRTKLPAEVIDMVRNRLRAAPEEINEAVASALRVNQLYLEALSALRLSEADVRAFIRDTQEKAKIKLVALNASQFEDPAYQPTDAELQAQFDKYKDVDPGQGEGGYGYRLPEEAQIEYIKIDAELLVGAQTAELEEAKNYWERELKPTPTTPDAQPTTNPAKPFLTFTPEARDEAMKRLRQEKAKQEALRLGTEIVKTLKAPWADAPTSQPATQPSSQPTAYKIPPQVAIEPNPYPPLADEYSQRTGNAVTYNRLEFRSKQDLGMVPGLMGTMALRGSQESVRLVDAAFLVPGIEHPEAEQKRYARWFHNIYETVAEPFVDNQGNVYVMRTLAVKPKRAPASWQEVKNDRVRQDLKTAHGEELAKQAAEQLAAQARQMGLEAAVQADPALLNKLAPMPTTLPGQPPRPRPDPVRSPAPFARKTATQWGGMMPAQVPELGYDPDGKFGDQIFALADQADKTLLYNAKGAKRWIVAQLVEIIPVTEQEYINNRPMAEQMLGQNQYMLFSMSWLDGQNIRARVGYVPKYPEEDKAADKERM